MKDKRRDKMKRRSREEKREDKKREEARQEKGQDEDDFFFKKCFKTPNAPDELAQNVSKKSLSDENVLVFPSKVQNLTVFSIIYMIRIRFFGRGELIQNGFSAAR